MANKTYIVDFHFPKGKAAHAWFSTTIEASNFGLAANRGWQEVKKREHVKGKRFSEVKITVQEAKPDETSSTST